MTMAHTNNPNASHLSCHLSEDALNDLLIGLGTEEAKAHVAACPECRSRVEEFQSTVQAFHTTSMAWSEFRSELKSESRSGSLKESRPSQPSRRKISAAYAAPLGWALAAAILLAVGIPTWNAKHRRVENLATTSTPVANSADSDAQIAQDNELLRSVNLALSSQEDSPLSEYHLLEKPHAHGRARAASESNLRSQ